VRARVCVGLCVVIIVNTILETATENFTKFTTYVQYETKMN